MKFMNFVILLSVAIILILGGVIIKQIYTSIANSTKLEVKGYDTETLTNYIHTIDNNTIYLELGGFTNLTFRLKNNNYHKLDVTEIKFKMKVYDKVWTLFAPTPNRQLNLGESFDFTVYGTFPNSNFNGIVQMNNKSFTQKIDLSNINEFNNWPYSIIIEDNEIINKIQFNFDDLGMILVVNSELIILGKILGIIREKKSLN